MMYDWVSGFKKYVKVTQKIQTFFKFFVIIIDLVTFISFICVGNAGTRVNVHCTLQKFDVRDW